MEWPEVRALAEQGVSGRQIAVQLNVSHTTIRRRMDKMGIRTDGKRPVRTWSDEQFLQAVAESSTIIQCIRLLGLSDRSMGNYDTIHRHLRRLTPDTTHWTGRSGPRSYKPPIEQILVEDSPRRSSFVARRLLKEGVKSRACESCSRAEWMGSPIPLNLHHNNGNRRDHRIENLRFLCPNCQASLPSPPDGERGIGKDDSAGSQS